MKEPKEGAVNKKKRLKYCAESGQWIPYNQWKRHKAALVQIEEAKKIQDIQSYAETPAWNPALRKVNELEKQVSDLKYQLNKKSLVLNGYRETLGSAGRLLAALVDVSEIN